MTKAAQRKAKMDELKAELAEYSRKMYPGMEVLETHTPEQGRELDRQARRHAVRIADLVIDLGLVK